MANHPSSPLSMTREQALRIARDIIQESGGAHDMIVLDDQIVETEFGWVFFYQPRRFLETGDFSAMVPGNSPLVVHKADGSTRFLGTSLPPDRAIANYLDEWRQQS